MKNLICNQNLRQHIQTRLDDFQLITHEDDQLRLAAVAITIVDIAHDPAIYDIPFHEEQSHHAAIILTKRAAKMRKHANQWALPGGRMDPGETPEETALRELSEEVGLQLSLDRVLGRLDDFTTRSGFIMKTVVVWGGKDVNLAPNPDEVAAIHRIPVAEFMREDSPILHNLPDSEQPVLLMPVGNNWIAAPTAALLYQFREVAILGNETRVAHYEQPFFARK